MANKIKLGNRPKTFKPFEVQFEMPDGGQASIEVTFKYFTKTESGAIVDELIAKAKEKDSTITADLDDGLEGILEKTRDHNAAYMLRVIESWNLDEELSIEALQQLDDEIPAATTALMDAFTRAARQGRLGN